jgi:small subunit ribosomal protein S13
MKQFNIFGSNSFTDSKVLLMHGLLPNKKYSNTVKIPFVSFLKKHILKEEIIKKILIDQLTLLIENNTFRGYRHKVGLPVNGQKTHNNRKTQRKLYRKRWLI